MKTTSLALRLLWLSTLTFLLVGCPLAGLPEPPKPECSHASDCTDGRLCGPAGVCIDQCKGDRDCPRNATCDTGVCKALPGTCAADGDCATGEACAVNGKCVTPCASTAECGPGFTCLGGTCLSTSGGCGRDVECGPSEVCAANGTCVAPCSMDSQCAATEACSAGACVPKQATCSGTSGCTPAETCSPASVCQVACTTDAQCPNGQGCASGFCALLPPTCTTAAQCPATEACGAANLCSDKCLSSRDCQQGLVCTAGVCSPPAPSCITAAECGTGQACSPAGACVTACTTQPDCAGADECSAGACVPTGAAWAKLVGTVALSGITDASGVEVRVRGNAAAVTVATAADGSFAAAGLPPGRYTVTLNARSVREGLVELDVAATAGATTTVPATTLTPVGTVTGRVTLQGLTNHQGTQLALAMANAGGTADAAGDFTIRNVPVGTFTLNASAGGFAAGTVTGIAVQWDQTTTVPPFSLSPLPVSNNTTFAFLSVPPGTVVARQPFVYTAVAGGGGVTNPSYALISGPGGMSVDSATGVVTWTPAAAQVGNHFVTMSARGGGMTVFHIFAVDVLTDVPARWADDTQYIAQNAGTTWISDGYRTLSTLGTAADGGSTAFTVGAPAQTHAVTQIDLLQGGRIADAGFLGQSGAIASVSGPFGAASATWPGGTVGTLATATALQLAATPTHRTVGSAALLRGGRLVAAGPPTYRVTALAGLRPITSVDIPTGTATGVAATQLTDSAGGWANDALLGRCLSNAAGVVSPAISANTATTITVGSGDLTELFATGSRYFAANCSGGTMAITVHDTGATFGGIVNSRADLYVDQEPYRNCTVTANATTSFTCTVNVSEYAAVSALSSVGRYGIGTASGIPMTLTAAAAAFPAGLSSSNRLRFAPALPYGPMPITANTATDITFTAPLGWGARFSVGQDAFLTTTGNPYWSDVTVTFASNVLSGSHVGERLFVDAANLGATITANTDNSATVRIEYWRYPLTNWPGSLAAVAVGNPELQLTDSAGGLPPLVGHVFSRPQPYPANVGTIIASSASQVTVALGTSTGALQSAVSTFAPGAVWAWASPSTWSQAQLEVPLAGNPALAPDSLVGRSVALASNPSNTVVVRANGAASLTVEGSSSTLNAFWSAPAGSPLYLGEGDDTFVVRVTDPTASWTPGQWVGQWVVSETSAVGTVRANTATSVDIVVASGSLVSRLAEGRAFGFAPAGAGECPDSAGPVPFTVSLAGATLTPGAYTTLHELSNSSHPVLANTSASLTVGVCSNRFAGFVGRLGQDMLATAGTEPARVTLTNAAATLTPSSLAGRQLAFPGASSPSLTVAANTASTLDYLVSGSEFFSLAPSARVGKAWVAPEADGRVLLALSGAFGLPPGAVANHFVMLLDPEGYWAQGYFVESNTATQVTLRLSPNDANNVLVDGASRYQWLSTSGGLVVRYTVAGMPWTPGELAGGLTEAPASSGQLAAILDNTANTVTVATDSVSYNIARDLLAAQDLEIRSSTVEALSALPSGDALVALWRSSHPSQLARVSPAGVVTTYPGVSASRALVLSPLPSLVGRLTGSSSSGGYTTSTDATASFTPGALKGAVLRARSPGSIYWSAAVIVDNTATTLESLDGVGGTNAEYVIEPSRYTVSGTTLAPDELVGTQLTVGGRRYWVRSNTATEVSLYARLADDESPAAVTLPNTPALLGGRPGASRITSLASNGAAGAWLSTNSGLWHFDGAAFTELDRAATGTPGAQGTVSSVTTNSITDSSAPFVPGALAGSVVRLRRGLYTINSNTDRTLFLADSFYDGTNYSPPLPQEPYAIFAPDGVATPTSASVAGTTVWVAANNGLFKRQGSTWSRYTVASTESSLGAGDGLPWDSLDQLAAASPTEVWLSPLGQPGLARLSGTTWTHWTVSGTESSPGAADGLPNDTVDDLLLVGTDVFLACNGLGAARLSGSTWTRYDASLSPSLRYVTALGVGAAGNVLMCTYSGVFDVAP